MLNSSMNIRDLKMDLELNLAKGEYPGIGGARGVPMERTFPLVNFATNELLLWEQFPIRAAEKIAK